MAWHGLVLGGGGARGEFELGALQHLIEVGGWEFDFVTGVSVGALNASILALHGTLKDGFEELLDFWDSIQRNQDVYTGSMLTGSLASLFTSHRIAADSIYDSRPLAKLVSQHVQWDRMDRLFAVGVTSLTDCRYYLITNHGDLLDEYSGDGRALNLSLNKGVPGSIPDRLPEFVLASASMPLLFPPVDIHGHRFVDGGLREITPLAGAMKAARISGDKECRVVVISTAPAALPQYDSNLLDSGLEIILRSLEIMAHEILENDLKLAEKRNKFVRRLGPAPEGEKNGDQEIIEVEVINVRPPSALGYESLEFEDLAKRNRARKLGAEAMKKALEEHGQGKR